MACTRTILLLQLSCRSQDSAVSIVTRLRNGQPKNYGSIPGKGKRFSLFQSIQAGMGPTQPHIHCTAGAVSSGVKRSERETDHSPPSVADVRNEWHDISTPPHAFMACTVTALYQMTTVPQRNQSGFWIPRPSWPLKMWPIGCPETSVRNCHYTLRNIAKQRRSHLEIGTLITHLRLVPVAAILRPRREVSMISLELSLFPIWPTSLYFPLVV
jgi:hypothetical protein